MNWYSIFYWLTVADGVKNFFDIFSNIFTWLMILSLIAYTILGIAKSVIISGEGTKSEEEDKVNPEVRSMVMGIRLVRPFFYTMTFLSLLTWAGYVFTPSKKDAIIIVAGGAVGNFITHDTSARQIPTEVMTMLRAKIREVSAESIKDSKDALESMTKEELIEQLRKK